MWKPIETAPWDKTIILKGESGYIKPHDIFIINGYKIASWHQGEFNDVTGTPLTEVGNLPIGKK